MKRLIILGLTCIALIASCDGDVVITTYVQDLLDLKGGKEAIAYTTVNVTTSSVTKDAEREFVRSVIGNISNERTSTGEYSQAYSFDTKVPILGADTPESRVGESDLLHLRLQRAADGVSVAYRFNKTVLDRIDAWVSESYMSSFGIDGFSVTIRIDNDSRDDFSLTARSVYINEAAYPFEVQRTLKRRESVNLTISDVLGAAVGDSDGYVPFMTF